MKKKKYLTPVIESAVMVTDNIIAASAPAARDIDKIDTDGNTGKGSGWGNIWNN
jgi:hypothetical protein